MRTVLKAAGRLAEVGAWEKQHAAQSTLILAEARAMLHRVGGEPISELNLGDARAEKVNWLIRSREVSQ